MSEPVDGTSVPELVPLRFDTDAGFGARARIGLVVLETDQTLEAEARSIDLDGVDFYHSRIAMEPEVTSGALTDMRVRLPEAAALLPREFEFDAIGYGCTAAAALIGTHCVAACLDAAHPGVPNTDPINAAVAAWRALDARRIAVVTPYSAEVSAPIAEHFVGAGLEVTGLGSFLESNDLVVGRISRASIARGVRTITSAADCEAVFVSCTSLRVIDLAADLEAEIGVPVVSSNTALLWHLLRLAGVDDDLSQFGCLFARPLGVD